MQPRLSCRKYRSLRLSAQDVRLSLRQEEFLKSHGLICQECLNYDSQISAIINALQTARLDHQGTPAFSLRVLWSISLEKAKAARRAWRPLAVGAATAVVALGAVLQVLTATPGPGNPSIEGGATRERNSSPIRSLRPGQLNLFDTPSRLVEDPHPADV